MGDVAKDRILRQIYYDESGFGSINETYKEAKKLNPNITLEYTKQWMTKQKINN